MNAEFINLREIIREMTEGSGEDTFTFQVSDDGDSITLETDNNVIEFWPDGTYTLVELEDEDVI
jgi:hypothetical protein